MFLHDRSWPLDHSCSWVDQPNCVRWALTAAGRETNGVLLNLKLSEKESPTEFSKNPCSIHSTFRFEVKPQRGWCPEYFHPRHLPGFTQSSHPKTELHTDRTSRIFQGQGPCENSCDKCHNPGKKKRFWRLFFVRMCGMFFGISENNKCVYTIYHICIHTIQEKRSRKIHNHHDASKRHTLTKIVTLLVPANALQTLHQQAATSLLSQVVDSFVMLKERCLLS